MGLFLLLLSLFPLLSLEPLRWFRMTKDRHAAHKAFFLAFFSAFLWPWLADYASSVYGWHWPFYVLAAAGAGLCAHFAYLFYPDKHRRLRALAAVAGFLIVYGVASWTAPGPGWLQWNDEGGMISALSRARNGLWH
jgi:hypothetical protein